MMSSKNLKDHCDLPENEEKLLARGEDDKSIPGPKCNSEDVFSVGSVSPYPLEDALAISNVNPTEWLLGQGLDKPELFAHLNHVSPLESIRELVELEEPCEQDRREDRAVVLKGQTASKEKCPTTIIRYMSVRKESGGDALEYSILEDVVESTAEPDEACLENSLTDACSSVLDVGTGSVLQEAFTVSKHQPVEWCFSSICNEQEVRSKHSLTPRDAKSAVLEIQMDDQSSTTHLENFQNPKEGHVCSQNATDVKTNINDQSDSELKSVELGSPMREKEDTGPSVTDQTLIEVLTACKAKVEHLEQVKASSFDLSVQLQNANARADTLNQRVLCLEHECRLREKEFQELTVTLSKTSAALQTRDSEMATVTKELHQLQFELEAKKKMAVPARTNGQVNPASQKGPVQNSRSSTVCTLF